MHKFTLTGSGETIIFQRRDVVESLTSRGTGTLITFNSGAQIAVSEALSTVKTRIGWDKDHE